MSFSFVVWVRFLFNTAQRAIYRTVYYGNKQAMETNRRVVWGMRMLESRGSPYSIGCRLQSVAWVVCLESWGIPIYKQAIVDIHLGGGFECCGHGKEVYFATGPLFFVATFEWRKCWERQSFWCICGMEWTGTTESWWWSSCSVIHIAIWGSRVFRSNNDDLSSDTTIRMTRGEKCDLLFIYLTLLVGEKMFCSSCGFPAILQTEQLVLAVTHLGYSMELFKICCRFVAVLVGVSLRLWLSRNTLTWTARDETSAKY